MKRSWAKYWWGIAALLVLAASAAACSAHEDSAATAGEGSLIQFRLARAEPAPGLEPAEFEGDTLYLESPPILSDEDFEGVEPYVGSGEWHLDFELTPEAGERLSSVSSNEIGTRLAILIDSELRSAPVIRDRLGSRGKMTITASQQEADRLSGLFRSRWPEGP